MAPAGAGPGSAWGGAPALHPRPFAPPPPIGVSVGVGVLVPLGPAPLAPPAPSLPTAQAWLDGRSWLDGDAAELTLELVDARTGEPRWRRTVQEAADPREAGEISALIDRALADQPFGKRVVPLAPAEQAAPAKGGNAPAETPGEQPPPWPEASPEEVLPPEP